MTAPATWSGETGAIVAANPCCKTRTLAFREYPRRAILGASLMITQSFLYNAIFFTYAIVLTKFYGVSANTVPIYGLAFSVGNLAGPLLLGHLFDTWGRKKMISGTYIAAGILLALSAWLFEDGRLDAETQTMMWVAIFFLASAGASAAYLTVSETWPIEIRAEAIAVFFAIAQIVGALGPVFYGALIGDGTDRTDLFIGYLSGLGSWPRAGSSRSCSGSMPSANRSNPSHGLSPRSPPEREVAEPAG